MQETHWKQPRRGRSCHQLGWVSRWLGPWWQRIVAICRNVPCQLQVGLLDARTQREKWKLHCQWSEKEILLRGAPNFEEFMCPALCQRYVNPSKAWVQGSLSTLFLLTADVIFSPSLFASHTYALLTLGFNLSLIGGLYEGGGSGVVVWYSNIR